MEEKLFKIVEIFGPTIQGEGSNTGLPVTFVRFAGCDFHCGYKLEDGVFVPDKKHPWRCDTQYSWDTKRFGADWKEMSKEAIVDAVGEIGCKNIVFSGGNPALQDLGSLISFLHSMGHFIQMETQGSVVKVWFKDIDFLTISPKPPSSGMKFDMNKFKDVVLSNTNREIKIVLDDTKEDFEFFKMIYKEFPKENFVIQVLNTSPGSPNSLNFLLNRYRKLIGNILTNDIIVENNNIKILPQVHVFLWGNERGR